MQPVVTPTYNELFRTFLKIGCLSFGGPAGQIALMHKMIVDEKKWVDEKSYLGALNFCMLLPGPEAMQLATWIGWRLHGLKGGLTAGLLFVIPGALVVLALSMLYAAYGKLPVSEALLRGVKAAVLAIVVEALLRIAKRGLKANADKWLAGAAFLAIYAFGVPFPVIVAAAALIGFWRGSSGPATTTTPVAQSAPVSFSNTLKTIAIWGVIWAVPLLAIAAIFGQGHVLTQLGWFFSKLAVVTFGGGYAVLAYMGQDVVTAYKWLQPGEMVDGLGLAETTPGPLILVTEYVGYLTAHRHSGGSGHPVLMGTLGAAVALWATFAPCFLWIFAGAPYIERLNSNPRLKSALAGVTAAVVGVILNLTVWFALHVLFARVGTVTKAPLTFVWPDVTSVSWSALGLSALAFVLLFAAHRGIITTLAICAALSVVLRFGGLV